MALLTRSDQNADRVSHRSSLPLHRERYCWTWQTKRPAVADAEFVVNGVTRPGSTSSCTKVQ
jgi:hypothetical protein